MDLARRLARLPLLAVMIAVCAAVVTIGARASAPHAARTLDAVERDRDHITIDLRPGAQRTRVFDSDGSPIGILVNDVDREIITLDQVPDDVIATIVAVEDSKFWLHNGVDLRATARALVSNVSAGGIASGGSTITQQIVKLRVVGSERSFNRKIREAVIAARLEEDFTKEEILEFYVNEVYLGNGAYGLQAGAETYFGKDVSALDVGDAAFLASLIRSPGLFDGFDQNIDTMTRRRSRSLQQAVDAGIITEAQRDAFERRPLPSRNLSPRRTDVALRRDYFLVEVRRSLLANPALGDTYQARFSQVFGGGLRVWTTLRPELQRAMRTSVAEVLPEGTGEFEVSIVSVDPTTGAVHAFIGGPAFSDSEFNLATQGRRQPGSSFKTYVLAAAIERAGLYPFDTISGQGPCVFPNPPLDDYEVSNFANSPGRVATLEEQATASSNCAFVRLGLITGLDEVVGIANRLIGRSDADSYLPYPSISLGAQEITPLEQAVAYGTFANGGVRMEPFYVTRIENNFGEVLYEHVPHGRRVVSQTTADWVTSVLEENVRTGTGTRSTLESGQVSAGKTGTTQQFHDAWFVGFTPHMSTAVWMGHPDEQVPMGEIQERRATGGWIPARIWSAYMGGRWRTSHCECSRPRRRHHGPASTSSCRGTPARLLSPCRRRSPRWSSTCHAAWSARPMTMSSSPCPMRCARRRYPTPAASRGSSGSAAPRSPLCSERERPNRWAILASRHRPTAQMAPVRTAAWTALKRTKPDPDTRSLDGPAAMTPESDASVPGPVVGDEVPGPSPLEILAQIGDLDIRLDQIVHRVRNLPEREIRAGIEAELGVLASEAKVLDAQIAGLERQQRRHEDEVARIEAKRAHNSERLYDSHLTSPKEAEALTAEADALGRHQTEIEDQILDLMEELEPLTDARADLAQRQSEAAERMAAVGAAIGAAEGEAGGERDEVLDERAALVASADPALVSIYEDRRADARGTPVLGRLIGLTCSACHLEIPSVEYERITSLDPDELAECPHCGALLVR